MKRLVRPLVGVSIALTLALIHTPGSVAPEVPELLVEDTGAGSSTIDAGQCAGTPGSSMTVFLTSSQAPTKAPAVVPIGGRIRPAMHLVDAIVNFRAVGAVELLTKPPIHIGSLSPDQDMTFEIAAQFFEGYSRVDVEVRGTSADDQTPQVRRESFHVLFVKGRWLSGTKGLLDLEQRSIVADLRTGKISKDQAREQARALRRAIVFPDNPDGRKALEAANRAHPGARFLLFGDSIPSAPNDEDQWPELPVEVGPASLNPESPNEEDEVGAARQALSGAAATITVEGQIHWADSAGGRHPLYGATVQVRDDDTIGSELVASGVTGPDGRYHFVVDNDDGFGAGNRDIFVRMVLANGAIEVTDSGLFTGAYIGESRVYDEVSDGTVITENLTCSNRGTGPACSVLTGASYAATYAATLNGNRFLGQVQLEWPGDSGSANYDGDDINLRPGDSWDWDVIAHEYGHYVTDVFGFDDNPGGPHVFQACQANARGSKGVGIRLAWGEGWPDFFGVWAHRALGLASLGVPSVGDTNYDDGGESSIVLSLENQTAGGRGEDNELAVARILWDLHDTASDGRDNVALSNQFLFDRLNATNARTLSAAWNAYRDVLRPGTELAIGAVATDHRVGPAPTSPADGAVITSDTATFNWTSSVGCPTSYTGNSFDLVFYQAGTLDRVLTIPGITGTSQTLFLSDMLTLFRGGPDLVWAVEARHTGRPATGSYLGEGFNVTVDLSPEANPGGPYETFEGSPVMLDGSASSSRIGLGRIVSYEWDLEGGGHFVELGPTVLFDRVGRDGINSVGLRVTDILGQTDVTYTHVRVRNSPPSLIVLGVAPVAEGTPAIVEGRVVDRGWLDILTAHIDWDDGRGSRPVSGRLENNPPNAQLSFVTSNVYEDEGRYRARICGLDDDDSRCTLRVIVVSNAPPRILLSHADVRTYQGDRVTLPRTTFTDAGSADTHTASIDWGDGTPPAPGTLTESGGAGEVTGTHTYTTPGIYRAVVTITDDDGGSVADGFPVYVAPSYLKLCLYGDSGGARDLILRRGAEVRCDAGARGGVTLATELHGHLLSFGSELRLAPEAIAHGDATAAGSIRLRDKAELRGSAHSGANVIVGQDAAIRGDATAVGTVRLGPGAVVDGTILTGGPAPEISPVSSLDTSLTAGGPDHDVRHSLSLDPGSYGHLRLRRNTELKLSAGVYHFESITAGRDSAIRMDLTRGTIRIDVVGNVTLGPGHETSFFGADASAGTILFRVGGELQLRENGTFLGTFIVPKERATLYAGSTLRGAIYGHTVDVRAAHIDGEPVVIWFFLPLIAAP